MSDRIFFRCSNCHAQLSAPSRLVGRYRDCPGCGQELMIPPRTPNECPSLLVPDDGYRRPKTRVR
jgi:DNA-directed RNA polymerase subunit RPC12/RpoP